MTGGQICFTIRHFLSVFRLSNDSEPEQLIKSAFVDGWNKKKYNTVCERDAVSIAASRFLYAPHFITLVRTTAYRCVPRCTRCVPRRTKTSLES